MSDPIVIIGAGQAGLQTAESLRSEGYTGPVLMLGDEPRAPYHRPPLSKAYLLGEFAESQLTIRLPEALAKKNIELRTGVTVSSIDRSARKLHLSDHSEITYSGLCIATGSRARPLPVSGADLQNVLPLRTMADTQAIAKQLSDTRNIVVIGGGFIGLEFAAVARKLGKEVVVLEAADRLMARAVTPMMSEYFRKLHEAHGVKIKLGASVTALIGEGGKVIAARTADGCDHLADLVIAGIGILPNGELAMQSGIECDRGAIIVDGYSRTSDPHIVAAGDCTARRLANGQLLRLESVQNAVEQGKSAAAALLGKERQFTASPWFWSDQFDVKLQMVGLSAGYDQAVIRGDMDEKKFSVFYFAQGKLLAVDSVNRPEDHMPARKLLDLGISPTPAQVADTAFALNSLAK